MILCVDYASTDGGHAPDCKAAAAAGVGVAIIRRSNCYYDVGHKAWHLAPDTTYERDAQLWRDAGVVVGSYGFWAFHAGAPTPAEQVANFVAAPGEIQKGIDLPPASDVEFPGSGVPASGLTQAECFAQVKSVDVALTAAYGVRPLTYTSHVQWCDTNGLGGPAWPDGAGSPLWIKTPYRLGPGHPLDQVVATAPHFGPVMWDPHDYWRVPPPWNTCGHWLQQWQGDCAGFPGFDHRVDVGSFNVLDGSASVGDSRWTWVTKKLGSTPTMSSVRAFQSSHGLIADGVIGPKSFAALAWS